VVTHLPTIIFIGGPFVADSGELLDSRQPFADDPLSATPRRALAESELWWRTATSLVVPLLRDNGNTSFASVYAKTVTSLKADGSVMRRSLAPLLPGGIRPSDTRGRWQLTAAQGVKGAHIWVETAGVLPLLDYELFESSWKNRAPIAVVPHTYADTVFFDGYTQWVADGRPKYVRPPLERPSEPRRERVQSIVTIEGDFRVTGIVRRGAWCDPVPLDAARALLQARYDLQLGIWDLANNETLRSTLLRETPIAPPPAALAGKTEGILRRAAVEQTQTREADQVEAARDVDLASVLATLDQAGWSQDSTEMQSGAVAQTRFARFYPIAVAPQCDEIDAPKRHPALRPGKIILWLEFEMLPKRNDGECRLELIVPPPLNPLNNKVSSYLIRHLAMFKKIADPDQFSQKTSFDIYKTSRYELVKYEPHGEFTIDDWQQRIAGIARRTTDWAEALSPLAVSIGQAITKRPAIGRR